MVSPYHKPDSLGPAQASNFWAHWPKLFQLQDLALLGNCVYQDSIIKHLCFRSLFLHRPVERSWSLGACVAQGN